MVSKVNGRVRAVNPSVGRQILDIITSGMYNNPLMAIREYIQNAADSIDEGISRRKRPLCMDDAAIKITISGQTREIAILDTGTGISNEHAEERLGSLGFSNKEGSGKRGFRGIGRLGGLGYCSLLRFETRSQSKEQVAVVEWDGNKLRRLASDEIERLDLKKAIKKIASIRMRPAKTHEPSHFFKVTMVSVNRFHADVLMNIKGIRAFLSQVAPVPYLNDSTFTFGAKLHDCFSEIPNYRTYNIFVNDQKIYKPYTNEVIISTSQTDTIQDITMLPFTNPETGEMIGLGWFANTSLKSSLPKSVIMRGIRVRHGNIEVGGERFLDHIYSERRFATWHIGEIHLNHGIKLNARRDGFEETADFERFLERVSAIGKSLSRLCRESSAQRSRKLKAMADLVRLEETTSPTQVIIDKKHHSKMIDDASSRLESIKPLAGTGKLDATAVGRIKKLEKRIRTLKTKPNLFLNRIDGRKLGGDRVTKKQILQEICSKIITAHKKEQHIEKTLHLALKDYLK